MKKFVALIVGLSLVAPVVSAQSNIATGTFTGNVGGMCVVKSPGNAYTGNLVSTAAGNRDSDGFATRLAGSADFSFKSNAPCTATSSATATGPSGQTLSPTCNTNGATSLTTPTVLANNSDAVNATVNAELTRSNSYPLLAGQYTLICTTTLTAGTNQ